EEREIRRVLLKGKVCVLTEHWILEKEISDLIQLAYSCSGYNQNQLNQARQTICARWINPNEVLEVLPKLGYKNKAREVPCPISAFDSKFILENQLVLGAETRMENQIKIETLEEFEIIRNQHFGKNIDFNLRKFLKKNIEEDRRNLVFYTDRSLLGIEHNSKMCIGWIQINVDRDSTLIKYTVKCTSLNRSKRVSTQIKCQADKLPTLSELSLRRPDIYPDAKCTTCSTRQNETQDHLALCPILQWQWYNIIDITLSVAWSKLTRKDRLNLTKEDLKILVCGTTHEEELHLRTNIIKGLFTQKATDNITNKL
ncbi:22385_t:CDS:2, partial [Gigaspora rosea]